jgi:hypothetical protein
MTQEKYINGVISSRFVSSSSPSDNQSRTNKTISTHPQSIQLPQTTHTSSQYIYIIKMYGLHAPSITCSEFDGSDVQLALALKLAADKKRSGSTTTSNSGSTTSSARASLDEKNNTQQSSATPAQKKRLSMFKAAATVFSLK